MTRRRAFHPVTPLAAAGAILLSLGTAASAHRLDEYLQATTISLERDRVHAEVRLTPGVAVFRRVMAAIDTDGDGVLSGAEQQAYAERVLRDLSLAVNGDRLPLRLVSWEYPPIEEMKEGLGDIRLAFDAAVPDRDGHRRLHFENHHQSRMAAYLVNCLVPRDPDIQITGQQRDYRQSRYQLDYMQAGAGSSPLSWATGAGVLGGLGSAAWLLFGGLTWRRRPRVAAPGTASLPTEPSRRRARVDGA